MNKARFYEKSRAAGAYVFSQIVDSLLDSQDDFEIIPKMTNGGRTDETANVDIIDLSTD